MERRVEVFFYGLFMDADALREKGFRPTNARQASVEDIALHLGERATLVPERGGRVHGMLMSLTHAELDRLYAEPSVEAYRPEPVLASLRDGSIVAALCFNLPAVPAGARSNPEYAAKLRADHPGRFGNFAVIPLTDAEGSLKEIAYAMDTLKADGIGLMTSYGDKWLGDPSFLPVMEELNRRKAIVYTHPTAANCCVNLVRTEQPVMIEFGTDTTRTIADIIFSGNAQKFRDIRWIFSHAGGTMPILIDRFVRNPLLVPGARATVPDGTLAELKRFYYDTAQTSNKAAMSALSALIPVSQILFGTDFPYRTSIDHVKGLREAGVFNDAEIMEIERGNALKLLPRLVG